MKTRSSSTETYTMHHQGHLATLPVNTQASSERSQTDQWPGLVPSSTILKPVLNWAIVCSPNILRTVRRTMIRFLIELLVRRTWFGQFEEFIVLNCKCKLRPELAADSMIENVG